MTCRLRTSRRETAESAIQPPPSPAARAMQAREPWRAWAYRINVPRNSRPTGDIVRSPADSGNDLTRPSPFASTISVTPRPGTVTTSDDDAFPLTPNCQTIVSPLYVCTNQPIPCGSAWPLRPMGGCQAAASVPARTRTPSFLSATSNFAKSRVVEMRPLAGVIVVAVYWDGEACPSLSTAYGIARRLNTLV